MTRYSTGRDPWAAPKPPSDPSLRTLHHGRILPMEDDRRPISWGAVVMIALGLCIAAVAVIEGIDAISSSIPERDQ